jgi:hypothetical protein
MLRLEAAWIRHDQRRPRGGSCRARAARSPPDEPFDAFGMRGDPPHGSPYLFCVTLVCPLTGMGHVHRTSPTAPSASSGLAQTQIARVPSVYFQIVLRVFYAGEARSGGGAWGLTLRVRLWINATRESPGAISTRWLCADCFNLHPIVLTMSSQCGGRSTPCGALTSEGVLRVTGGGPAKASRASALPLAFDALSAALSHAAGKQRGQTV